MITNYVISSPGRVGSTFLSCILRSTGKPVISIHDPCFVSPYPESTALIFLTRHNLFKSIMSAIINRRKNNRESLPYEVPLDDSAEFCGQYRWHRWYIERAKIKSTYAQISYLYFDDFVNNPDAIFSKFNETQQYPYTLPKEENVKYQDVIVNHQACKEKFDWYEKNPYYFTKTPWAVFNNKGEKNVLF